MFKLNLKQMCMFTSLSTKDAPLTFKVVSVIRISPHSHFNLCKPITCVAALMSPRFPIHLSHVLHQISNMIKGQFDKKVGKRLEKTIKFYEKLEKETSDLVKCSPSFSLFSWNFFLTQIPSKNQNSYRISHQTKSLVYFFQFS